jgi:hypothetical protein
MSAFVFNPRSDPDAACLLRRDALAAHSLLMAGEVRIEMRWRHTVC